MAVEDRKSSTGDEASSLGAPAPGDAVEEAAIRGRIAGRLFGAAASAVRIGRYEISDRLGAGSMGVVYAARDPELGRLVALKVLSSPRSDDPRRRQRLVSEARALARLSHPNVVQIHEVGVHEGAVFLALELVEGETLQQWQRRPGRRWPEIVAAYAEAARGLAAAHGVGIVHRDVKPSNVLVGVDGRVRVADFGLARDTEEAVEVATARSSDGPGEGSTRTGALVGTPAYMSPEQARGLRVDARSDQFSLCVALFEALHGLRPFEVEELRRLVRLDRAALRRRVPRGAATPRWLLAILARGLDPEPARRFPDLDALLAELVAAPRRRSRARVLGAGAGALGLGAWVALAPPEPATTCPAPSEALAGSWDDAARDEGRRAFLATGLPFAGETWAQVERALDAAVLAWSSERHAACRATWVERTQPPERYELGAACLAAHERALRKLALRLRTRPDPGLVTRGHELVAALGDPSRCARVEARDAEGLAEPTTRAAVEALREQLVEVRLLARLADLGGAARLAEEVLAAATMPAPLRAEALLHRAMVHRLRSEPADAARLLEEAEALAELHHDDRLVAAIFAEQIELAVHVQRDVARARIYARLHGARLDRVGVEAGERADHHDRLGELELLATNPAAALAQHEIAGRLRAQDDLIGRARSARGVGNALAELGEHERALAQQTATRALLARELGDGHPDVAILDMDLGLTLRDMGELERAREALLRAHDNRVRSAPPDDIVLARTRYALAELLLDRSEVDAALTAASAAVAVLERALPATNEDVTTALAVLSNVHLARRDWSAAAESLDRLIRSLRAAGAEISADMYINAGEYRLRTGRAADAAPHFDQALVMLSAEKEPDLELLMHALNGRAKVHLLQEQPHAARPLLERALGSLAATQHTELRAEILGGMARALRRTGGDPARVRRLAREALALFAEVEGAEASAAALRDELRLR